MPAAHISAPTISDVLYMYVLLSLNCLQNQYDVLPLTSAFCLLLACSLLAARSSLSRSGGSVLSSAMISIVGTAWLLWTCTEY
ncbi:hypothetical protein B0H63DRAFT_468245 [Podospora didyma]|uniref:Uncharacterized protein n=1 Tax=Podospora didyma TaxID=330526 RepID=A0AAE0NS54_9PEZI|nr:hypothetical protein B0H63DRAFT_468245 [Podospora didyma]